MGRAAAVLTATVLMSWACRPGPEPHPDGGSPMEQDAGTPDPEDAGTEAPDAAVPWDGGLLRVGTYNTHRFFDTVCDTGACGSSDYEELPTDAQFTAKADVVAAAIRTMAVDVVVLQELEKQVCLDALVARLDGAYPTAVLGEMDTAASVDVAVLASLPLLETHRYRSRQLTRADGGHTSFSREFLEVDLQWGPRRVLVFAAHFRSQANDDPERRLLEARMARSIVDERARALPDALIILAGDLNDDPGTPPLNALEADGGMFRVASELTGSNAYTYYYNGAGNVLDHLYISRLAAGDRVPGSAQVVRNGGQRALGDSDHAAVTARFTPP